MSSFDKKIAAVAAVQHQIITYADVEAAGGGYKHVATRVAAGRWDFFRDNVYRLAGTPWTYEARVFATVCAAGPGAVASYSCAARLHGMGFTKAVPEVSIPRGRFHRPDGLRVHTSSDLDRCTTVLRAGCIPVTDPARTVLDLAGTLKLTTNVSKAIEDGRRADLLGWSDVVTVLATHARQGRRGVTRLREAIACGYTENEATDTDSELMALSLFRQHNLAEPVVHHRIYDADGRIAAEIDLAYPDRRTGYEIDGSVHLDPVQKAKDDDRDDYLRTVYGWRIRRIWWEIPMYQPQKFVRIVTATLRERVFR